MKYTTPLVAILSVALLAVSCSAEPPGRQRGERAPGANGQRRAGEGQRGGAGASRDPQQMVARMMKEFDKDGDSKLNTRELTAMFTSMRERRDSGEGPGAAAGRKPGGTQRRGQKGEGKPGKPGGQKPKRPVAE
ncbi:MAG: hypothetical protein GY903_32455 [Fuerstiella sp.]|nr:hypothetical protein [Fuerstiella sp.]MCP4859204.1 hypothetical protein [Fuerstiella sp.]